MQQIVAKTDGVPLFVEELTKTVLEPGWLQEHEEHYELTARCRRWRFRPRCRMRSWRGWIVWPPARAVAQLGATIGRDTPV